MLAHNGSMSNNLYPGKSFRSIYCDLIDSCICTGVNIIRQRKVSGRLIFLCSGAICILHTWGQNLSLHPHIHCIVPSLGYSVRGRIKHIGKKGKYLYPVVQMSLKFGVSSWPQ